MSQRSPNHCLYPANVLLTKASCMVKSRASEKGNVQSLRDETRAHRSHQGIGWNRFPCRPCPFAPTI